MHDLKGTRLLGIVVGIILGVAAVLGMCAYPESKQLREKNQKVVRDGTSICKRSGCKPCGYFQYIKPELESGPEVQYISNYCEQKFLDKEANERRAREDQDIRERYK